MSDIVKELEVYVTTQSVEKSVKEMMMQCFRERPSHAESYFLFHLMNRFKNVSNKYVATCKVSTDGCIALSSKNQEEQEYIIAQNLPQLFSELLEKILLERPENAAEALEQLVARTQAEQSPPGQSEMTSQPIGQKDLEDV